MVINQYNFSYGYLMNAAMKEYPEQGVILYVNKCGDSIYPKKEFLLFS